MNVCNAPALTFDCFYSLLLLVIGLVGEASCPMCNITSENKKWAEFGGREDWMTCGTLGRLDHEILGILWILGWAEGNLGK